MGSFRAALTAGAVPNIIPTITDTVKARPMTGSVATGCKLVRIIKK